MFRLAYFNYYIQVAANTVTRRIFCSFAQQLLGISSRFMLSHVDLCIYHPCHHAILVYNIIFKDVGITVLTASDFRACNQKFVTHSSVRKSFKILSTIYEKAH